MINRNLFTVIFSILILFFLFQFGCRSSEIVTDETPTTRYSHPSVFTDSDVSPFSQNPIREFRAAWVATVANIDWPSAPGLSVDQQKQEMIALMNRAAALHLNAIIFQVRPAADAFYNSPYEPWSSYLTGKMGEPPLPFYDPLEFAIQEAHKRGLELHAWFNPYRAGHPTNKSAYSPDHISKTNPEFVHQYGDFLWLDPGVPEAKQHTIDVIKDVVERYNIDGVHFDDYFYPYPSYADNADFPDSLAWERAIKAGNTLSRSDWRRENVNSLMRELSTQIREMKPHVKFGISPFGVWRPGHPSHTTGFDAYEHLYADAKLWINEGWVDYFTPQIYYQMDQVSQPFPIMLNWWAEQNYHQRHIWPGLYTSRLWTADRLWSAEEIKGQIYTARAFPGVTGATHFSMKTFMGNDRNINRILAAGAYSNPALIPASPWMNSDAIQTPEIQVRDYGDFWRVSFHIEHGEQVQWWVLRSQNRERWESTIIPGHHREITMYGGSSMIRPDSIYLTAVSRTGIESEAATFNFPKMSYTAPNNSEPSIIKRNEWSDGRPSGYEANAIRKNVGHRDTLRFQDLTVIVDQMMRSASLPGHLLKFDPGEEEGDGYSESVTVRVHKQGVSELLQLNPGQSMNWYGYHISLLKINFQKNLADLEVASVGSLPVNRAALLESGNGNMRLRIRQNPSKIAITHHVARKDSAHKQLSTPEYLNKLHKKSVESDNRWDLPHHYYIDSEGKIYEGRNAGYAAEAIADFDPRGFVMISLLLSDSQENITSDQHQSIKALATYLSKMYQIKEGDLYQLSDLDSGVQRFTFSNNGASLIEQIMQ